jgi:hypothetical protein
MKTEINPIKQREELLSQIASCETMIRGKITSTYQNRTNKDGTSYQAGPYHRLQRWEEGKNKTSYIQDQDYSQYKEFNDEYHTFKKLCDRLAEVNEEITLSQTDSFLLKKNVTKRQPSKK